MLLRKTLLLLLPLLVLSCDGLYDSETGILKEALGQIKDKVDLINRSFFIIVEE